MQKTIIYLLLGFFSYYGFKSLTTESVSPEMFTAMSTSDSQCTNKSYCVIFYLAPWCPSCKKALHYLDIFSEVLPEYDAGLKIIIGMDSPDKLERMADQFSSPVIYDLDKQYVTEFEINRVPRVILIDQNGTILKQEDFIYWRTNKTDSVRKYISEILELE